LQDDVVRLTYTPDPGQANRNCGQLEIVMKKKSLCLLKVTEEPHLTLSFAVRLGDANNGVEIINLFGKNR
jgi:hypothetical protein